MTLNSSGVSWTTAGHSGNALNFDGASGYIEAADHPSLNLREAISVSAWVYLTGNAAGINTVIAKDGQYALQIVNGKVRFNVMTVAAPAWTFAEGGAVALNTWTHVRGTYDGVSIRAFLNNDMVGFTAHDKGVVNVSTNSLRVGGRQGAPEFFTGRIDEVRISSEPTGGQPTPSKLFWYAGPFTADVRVNTTAWTNVSQRSLTFTKRFTGSILRITYQDTLGTLGPNYDGCRWRYVLDGVQVGYFSAADSEPDNGWEMDNGTHQLIIPSSPAGSHTLTIQNQIVPGRGASECLSGWNQVGGFLSVEEIP